MLILFIGGLLVLIGAYLLVFFGNGECEKYVPRIGSLNVQGGGRDGRVKRRLEVRTSQG